MLTSYIPFEKYAKQNTAEVRKNNKKMMHQIWLLLCETWYKVRHMEKVAPCARRHRKWLLLCTVLDIGEGCSQCMVLVTRWFLVHGVRHKENVALCARRHRKWLLLCTVLVTRWQFLSVQANPVKGQEWRFDDSCCLNRWRMI